MKNDDNIISHLYSDADGWHIQSNAEHCEGVAEIAADFAREFGYEAWGRMLGLLHDRGKERRGFQQFIRRNSGYDETARSSDSHHHSQVGARIGHRLKAYDALYWISNPIAGHHRGLYDVDALAASVVTEDIPEGVDGSLPDIKLVLPSVKPAMQDANHVCRMLFSCLVDADRLDTERFMNPEENAKRGRSDSMHTLRERLATYMEELAKRGSTPINRIRQQIQSHCLRGAKSLPGFFELTVPTGGGKSLASVLWAVNHAVEHGKKRIVIAIPFTSIIVQTAAILREIFGDENVLEHHSAVSESQENDETRLAAENWDAPIIVTTNVQLFESMFSHKPGMTRKLHSLCNSVIVLDEVQSLPRTLLQPVVDAMRSYVRLFGVSFLFCTASQPLLDGRWKGSSDSSFNGLERESIRELLPADMALHERMRRVRLEFDLREEGFSEVAERISKFASALCVVNTRQRAYEIYSRLSTDESRKYHLSRQMCQAHILSTINNIKVLLAEGTPVTVVSTQLIEAGVDIDFPVVFRELAGLDSILQAAGRCNREGRLEEGLAVVFSLGGVRRGGSLEDPCHIMRDLVAAYPEGDWFSPEMMRIYYEMLYQRVSTYDRPGIAHMLYNPRECQYESASQAFRMIDNAGVDVIVNYGDSEPLVGRLKEYGLSKRLSRELGRYSVTVTKRTFEDLRRGGLIEEVAPEVYYIPLAAQYDRKTGLKTDNEYLEQTFVI